MKNIAVFTVDHKIKQIAVVCSLTLLVSACGGSGGSSNNNASNSSNLIIGGVTGGDASVLSDAEIVLAASNSSDAGLNNNLGNLSNLSEQEQDQSDTIFGPVVNEGDTQSVETLDQNSSSFLRNSMGIDEAGEKQSGATTSRDGNIVTVQPDANELCADEIPLAGGLNDNVNTCRELVNDLVVEINALSTETGVVSYLFNSAPVLLVGYSPTGVSYELKLDGMYDVLERAATLNSEPFDAASRLSGAFLLAATVRNDQEGSEAGNLSLAVSEPISSPVNDAGESLSLQNSTVFEIDFDVATGDSSIAIDWGALRLATSEQDEEGNAELNTVQLGGLSAALTINDNESGFVLSNVGIGNGLTVTIGDAEAGRLNLQQFGISEDGNGVVTLDGALNASVVLNNMSGWLAEYATNYTYQVDVNATQGTTVSETTDDGVYAIENGQLSSGVLVVGDDAFGDNVNESSTVSVMANECVESPGSETDTQQSIVIVACP